MAVNPAGRTFGMIAKSEFFFVLGTAHYLLDLRDQGTCYEQVQMAKALNKPTLLMLDQRLLPSEHEEIRQYLNGLEIIGTVFFDSEQMDDMIGKEIRDIIDNWKKGHDSG